MYGGQFMNDFMVFNFETSPFAYQIEFQTFMKNEQRLSRTLIILVDNSD